MEGLRSQRLLIRSSNLPAAGCGSGSFASTNFKAGRGSVSPSVLSCHSPHSFTPVFTSAMCTINCTTTEGNWLCPSACTLPPPGEVKFRAGSAGKWSSFSSSSVQGCRELLLVTSHPPGSGRRGYSVIIMTTPFDLWHRRRATTTTTAECVSYKTLKISASIFYWLKRKRKELPDSRSNSKVLSNGYHWGTPVLQRCFRCTSTSSAASRAELFVHNLQRNHRVGFVRSSTSDYYDGFRSVSSQAEGNTASLENATLVNKQREEFLATGYGWRVRDAVRGELRELTRVADIQTDAFHEKSAVFDDLFYKIFHAEVLTSLQYKARHSDLDRYSCLLAERDATQLNSLEGSEPIIVGAVDITAFNDKGIVCHLPGAEEYLYVSGMAVDLDYRRKGVATLLLEGCLTRAIQWGFEYLVLHAYEDDLRARNLYSRAGYNTISADPAWMTKFLGRRRRVVMARSTQIPPEVMVQPCVSPKVADVFQLVDQIPIASMDQEDLCTEEEICETKVSLRCKAKFITTQMNTTQ